MTSMSGGLETDEASTVNQFEPMMAEHAYTTAVGAGIAAFIAGAAVHFALHLTLFRPAAALD